MPNILSSISKYHIEQLQYTEVSYMQCLCQYFLFADTSFSLLLHRKQCFLLRNCWVTPPHIYQPLMGSSLQSSSKKLQPKSLSFKLTTMTNLYRRWSAESSPIFGVYFHHFLSRTIKNTPHLPKMCGIYFTDRQTCISEGPSTSPSPK